MRLLFFHRAVFRGTKPIRFWTLRVHRNHPQGISFDSLKHRLIFIVICCSLSNFPLSVLPLQEFLIGYILAQLLL
jgi:hypothetical protein